MYMIPQDEINVLLVLLCLGFFVPVAMEHARLEPSEPVKAIIVAAFIVAPILALIYNLAVTVIGVLT